MLFRSNGTVVNQVSLEQYWPCHIALLAQQSDVRFRHLQIIPVKSGRPPGLANAGIGPAASRDPSLPPDGSFFRLVNVKSGKALDVKDGSMNRQARLVQSVVGDRPSQLWTIRSIRNSMLLVNANSGQSIHVLNASNLNRQPLVQFPIANALPQECWIFHREGAAFRIACQKNNLIMAARDQPDADSPIIQIFPTGGREELWHVVAVRP